MIAESPLKPRTFDGMSIQTPADWVALEQQDGHAAWGSAKRSHTVTLASTEASVLPLSGVVGAVARDAEQQVPGATVVGRPRTLEIPGHAPRGDAAVEIRLRLNDGASPPLKIVQVWRRDSRAERDIVATWSSSSGDWPAATTASIPRLTASG